MLRRICTASLVFILANSCTGRSAAQTSHHRQKVVIISLDALGAESLHDPYLPTPTLHKLMQQGTYAVAMHPINPTVT